MNVYVYAIGGWSDHIHLVVAIPPKRAVSEVVKMLKGASSHYVNQRFCLPERFAWQEGYGVFTLGEKQRNTAVSYIQNQKKHHGAKSANAWLERTERVDDGPADRGLGQPGQPKQLREESAVYGSDDDMPF